VRVPTRSRVPDAEIAELRDVQFSGALRGYDREEVDRFVARVNQVLAELQITAAPESAIRHALKQVSEETQGILERAHETAEEITRRSRSQADDRLQQAETEARDVRAAAANEARELREAAEARVAELEADVQGILAERARIIEELRDLVRRLGDFSDAAAGRDPSRPPASDED
jgi:DivIVA domain-containing protein